MTRNVAPLTLVELQKLPAVVDLVTAARALGIGRTKAYELAKSGQFPCRVLRLGILYRIPTADLISLLGGPWDCAATPSFDQPDSGKRDKGRKGVKEKAKKNKNRIVARPTHVICKDCGDSFQIKALGPVPKRCVRCASVRNCVLTNKSKQARRAGG